MSGSLPLKYRPDDFEFVYGNKHAVDQVQSILKRDINSIPKSWLFTGGSGCGKTTMVRIIKEKLGCSDANFHEFNSANTNGIDTIREITANSRMSAMGGGCKVFLLDEFHAATSAAQNALLKVLEDTPKNTFFFLATTNPEKIKKAVKTRCTTITMKECSTRELAKLCTDIALEEGITLSPKIAKAIGNSSGGSPREALKILDQVIDIEDEEAAISAVEKTIGNESNTIELCQEFMNNCRWERIRVILADLYKDNSVEDMRRTVLGYFNTVLLGANNMHAAMILEQITKVSKYDADKAEFTLACYNAVFEINEASGTGKDVPF